MPHHLNLLYHRRMERKGALDAHSVGDTPDREAGTRSAVTEPDYHSLEDLDAFFVPLDNPVTDFHGITRGQCGDIGVRFDIN
jgi:hypothetical protein